MCVMQLWTYFDSDNLHGTLGTQRLDSNYFIRAIMNIEKAYSQGGTTIIHLNLEGGYGLLAVNVDDNPEHAEVLIEYWGMPKLSFLDDKYMVFKEVERNLAMSVYWKVRTCLLLHVSRMVRTGIFLHSLL